MHISQQLQDYVRQISLREHPVLRELRDQQSSHPLYHMQSTPEQAQFLQFLVRLVRAKHVLELGTFLGYTALAMSLALPEDGHLITCDRNPEWTNVAYPYWEKALQNHKIDLRLGPALETLETLVDTNMAGSFDFIFIDADKTNYVPYYEYALKLLQPHGLIAIDNVFWRGAVLDNSNQDAQTREIRRLNHLIQQDDRVDLSLLTMADGLFLIQLRKR